MNKSELGQLVAHLRKQQVNPLTGAGWRQEDLADATGLSIKTVADIEQGRRTHYDEEILLRLADGLNLTTLERQEFFPLAMEVSRRRIMGQLQSTADILAEVHGTLRALRTPAILLDPLYHVVAANRLSLALHPPVASQPEALPPQEERHFLRCVLAADSPVQRDMQPIWTQFLALHIHLFRAVSLRYRHTVYFRALFAELQRSAHFRQAWQSTQAVEVDCYTHLQHYRYAHPRHGALAYAATFDRLVTQVGPLYVKALIPCDDRTNAIFDALAKLQGHGLVELTPWPHAALTRHFDLPLQ